MNSHNVTWEDETSNRNIQFSISYEIENSEVKIADVTPTSVAFLCPTTKQIQRTIGVHTAKGKELLSSQFIKSGQMKHTMDKIAENENLFASV